MPRRVVYLEPMDHRDIVKWCQKALYSYARRRREAFGITNRGDIL